MHRAGTFRVVERHSGSGPPDPDGLTDGQPQYRIDQRPYQLADFAPTCWFRATSPAATFTQRTLCSLPTGTGRVSLAGTG
ncbi:arylamine N-acetyltransferase [Kitasatospora humi]|uniref:arylamine N-acetyltransferase n=1 Tax=Kitasatospora humi TaxID=2893891 RepID=UPI0035575D0B